MSNLPAIYTPQLPPPRPQPQWRRYVKVIRERWRVAFGVFALAVAASLGYALSQRSVYRATATLQFDAEPVNMLDFQTMRSGEATEDKFLSTLNTQIRLLQSWTLCDQTVKALALDQNQDFLQGLKPGRDLADVVKDNLKVQPIHGTRLVEVQVEYGNPHVAALLAEGVAKQYIQQNADRLMAASLNAVRWVGQHLVMETLKELNTALTKAEAERIRAEADWNQVKTFLEAGHKPDAIPTIASSPEVSLLRQQATAKEVAIAVLQRRYLAQHPKMIAAQTELVELNVKRAKAAEEVFRRIEDRYLSAKVSEEKIQESLKGQEQKAADLDRKDANLTELARNVETNHPLYAAVLARMKAAGLMNKETANNVHLLDPVQPPTTPVRPNKKLIVAFGLLLGAFLGVGFSLLLDALDDRIKSVADIESMGLPVLSGVPRMQMTAGGRVLQTQPNSACADAFRGLRASIGLKPEAKDAKTLMVTSTTAGEGKTMVAANLSIAYALHGERTLLIDCDLHHPGLGKIFRTQADKGLEKHLTGALPLHEVIQATDVPELEVICAGVSQQNCAELLSSPRLAEMLKEADELYDRIVIDSPPVMAVSDPLILLPHVKGVVFVVGSSKTHREDVERTMRKLRECGAPLVGVVMNEVHVSKGHYPEYATPPSPTTGFRPTAADFLKTPISKR